MYDDVKSDGAFTKNLGENPKLLCMNYFWVCWFSSTDYLRLCDKFSCMSYQTDSLCLFITHDQSMCAPRALSL